jgi:hypothetical protein
VPGLTSSQSPYHVTLTTADGIEIPLVSVAKTKNGETQPHEFEGSLTPVDATEQFRPGGIPKETSNLSDGAGFTFAHPQAPSGYNWGKNVWTMVENAAFPSGELTSITLPATNDGGTHGEIRAGFEMSGFLWFSTGKYGVQVTLSSDAATQVANFATVAAVANYVATSTCLYQGKAYWGGYDSVTQTAAPLIQHTLSGNVFTSGATCSRWHVASFFGNDGTGQYAEWLVGTVGTNQGFRYTNSASPLVDTNWTPGSTTGINIGQQNFVVNRIVVSRQQPFFLKQDGVYAVQRLGTYIPNITPHWADSYHQYNGIAGALIGGRLYASLLGGIDSVAGLDGQLNDVPRFVHPGADLPNENPAAGDTWSICRDGDYVVAAIYNNANQTSYICWGRPGPTRMIWHVSPCVIEGERVTWMLKSGGVWPNGSPRLWIATRNPAGTVSKLYWLNLPRNGNPLQDLASGGPWRCRTDTCTLYYPSNPWSQGVHSEKAVRRVATVSKACSETSYLAPYVSIDEATRVQLGENVTESPYVETRILDDLSGRQIAPSVDFKAGSNTTPPILRALTVWAGEGIRSSTVYQGTFRLARGLALRGGAKDDTSDPQATWELLIAAQGPRPATIVDWKSNVYTIALEQGAVWVEREVKNTDTWEIEFTMKFTVLAKETVYNDGSVYDSESVYES